MKMVFIWNERVNVVPLLKKGNREVALNLRPYSLRSVVWKLEEKLIWYKVENFLNK